jgi:membrane-associated phospholipid phosphatase
MWRRASSCTESVQCRGVRRRWPLCNVACLGIAFWCPLLRAQEASPAAAAEAIDTPQKSIETAQPGVAVPSKLNSTEQTSLAEAERDVSWRTLPRDFLLDQKAIWLFPVRLAQGRHWLPALAVTGATAGLIAADPHDTPYFRRTARFGGFNDVFSGRNTSAIMAGVPSAFLVVGYFRHDSYTEKTALLAGEAYADSAIVDVVMKMTTRRLRPSDIAPNGNFSDTFFNSHKGFSGTSTSFPSGHAAAAFSIATVFAHRYRQHRWVPWVAYGVACAIGFSRLTTQAHFPSDVFLGAALGYSIAKFDVLRPR